MSSEWFRGVSPFSASCARSVTQCRPTRSRQVVSLVLTRLESDYGNSILAGLPVYLVRQLQSVLNAAAWLIYHLRRSDHISDALTCLHRLRLRVPKRIEIKITVGRPRTCAGVPRLRPFARAADLPSRRSQRSVGTNRLVVPTSTSRLGD